MLGLTTGCVMHTREALRESGLDVVPFHANGTGGRAMERLVDEGLIKRILDLSLQELVGHVCHGLFDGGPDRMTAAARAGIPQVVVPGGTDYLVLGPLSSLTEEQRRRPLIVHNPNITLVRTNKDEMIQVAKVMAGRLNASTGPAAVIIPMGGFSQADVRGGAFADPDANTALIRILENELSSRVELLQVDEHINSESFARVVAEKMIGMAAS